MFVFARSEVSQRRNWAYLARNSEQLLEGK